ncbi:MAG: hypothetical protein H0U70_01820 [Tatlockia sp.]|nr:hypothetical protein [Tatlockia sp.]
MQLLNEFMGYFDSKMSLVKNTVKLSLLEAKLAGQNIFPLLICIGLLIPLALTLWCTLMVLIGYLLLALIGNFLLVLAGLITIQVLILLIIGKKILTLLREMSFVRTRALLNTKPMISNEKN